MNQPAIWILGSQNASSKLLTDLVSVRKQTIVMVTHDPSVAMIASRIIKIRDGAIEFDGPTEQAELVSDRSLPRAAATARGATS